MPPCSGAASLISFEIASEAWCLSPRFDQSDGNVRGKPHWQPRYGYDDSGAYRVHCRHSGRIAAIDTTPLTQFRNLSNWQLRNMVACTGCSNTTLRSTAGDMQVASRVPRWQS